MNVTELKGNGPPLLMLHGWGQTHEALLPLGNLLVPVSQPYLFDLPGFGKSPIPNDVWNAFDYADHFIRYLDQQKIKRTSLLGHSFGGKISLCLASRYPERVDKLILLAPSGIPSKRTLKRKVIRLAGKAIKTCDSLFGTSYFATQFSPRFGSADYKNAGAMRSILVRSVNEDLTPYLSKIQCPTLFLWGKKDLETPYEMGERYAALIPGARLVGFAHHDHYLAKDVGSHLCATHCIPFLRGDRNA